MKRVFHTWEKWECYPAGLYENKPQGGTITDDGYREMYRDFLRDSELFARTLARVLVEWPMSCEHYLSNDNMNRIAWLGQASVCLELGVPAVFRGGFNLLTDDEQLTANMVALDALNIYLMAHGDEPLSLEGAMSKTKANLY